MASTYNNRLIYAVAVLTVIIIIGAVGFYIIEPAVNNVVDAFYMTITTVTTVGYGDYVPTTDSSKILAAFIMLGGIGAAFFVMETFIALVVTRGLREEFGLPERRTRMKDHYIICGHGQVGAQVAEQLLQDGKEIIIIENRRERVEEVVRLGIKVIDGEAQHEEVLGRANITAAKGLITVLPEAYNVMVCLTARSMNPDLNIVAEVEDHRNTDKMIKAGADRVVQVNEMGARAMISHMGKHEVDPVCGGTPEEDISLIYNDKHFHFCCQECCEAFRKHPDRFLSMICRR